MNTSKPIWRYERPHRVRLFNSPIHFNNAAELTRKQVYEHCAEHFSKTPEYHWAMENSISMDFDMDDHIFAWHKTVVFYADLSEAEYIDYALRFFKHRTEWK